MTIQTKIIMAPSKEEQAFIAYLTRLLEQDDTSAARAAMAYLRRGLGKPAGAAHEMDRYVLDRLPAGTTADEEEPYYLVSSLFGLWHQGKDKAKTIEGEYDTERNLGKSLSMLVAAYTRDRVALDDARKRLDKLLNALLASHRDDLPERLRRVIALLRSKDVPVNWAQLLHDIRRWDTENRSVQHAWAKGFWIQRNETARDNK